MKRNQELKKKSGHILRNYFCKYWFIVNEGYLILTLLRNKTLILETRNICLKAQKEVSRMLGDTSPQMPFRMSAINGSDSTKSNSNTKHFTWAKCKHSQEVNKGPFLKKLSLVRTLSWKNSHGHREKTWQMWGWKGHVSSSGGRGMVI